ncbi:MAG: sigma-54-dependent Fis family transcriptional regulator [Bdellovibrionales bacterium]|nr:sigma-54-dependent Fis family transcriptional regulator [Bdellovibrionales bacterium]
MKIFAVEDEDSVRSALKLLLSKHEVQWFDDSADLVELSRDSGAEEPALILYDLRSARDPQGTNSLASLPLMRRRWPAAELVVQSGVDEVDTMRSCLALGAGRFVLKEHLALEIPALLTRLEGRQELRAQLNSKFVGDSLPALQLKREILNLRGEPADILIEGETGSGKEVCAEFLHAGGPWVTVNAAAIPRELFEAEFFGAEKGAYTGANTSRAGHFERAHGGTLFLDEVQSLPLDLQAKLLRVLETRCFQRVGSSAERPFRARVLAAANVPLREAVQRGQFREDLYYRLSSLTLRIPPLRFRADDIHPLVMHFLAEFDATRTKRLTSAGLQVLLSYEWPGNVRELRNFIRTAVAKIVMPIWDAPELMSLLVSSEQKVVSPAMDQSGFRVEMSRGLDENTAALEKFLLGQALRGKTNAAACAELKMSRSRFYEKLKQYGFTS